MSNEIEQTRYIVEYGPRLGGISQRVVERIVSHSHLNWVLLAEDELVLFDHVIQTWKDEFEGTAEDRVVFDAFCQNAKEAFLDSIFEALKEQAMVRFETNNDFAEQLEAARSEMARRRAMGIPDEPRKETRTVPPPAPAPKPDILYRTYEDLYQRVLKDNPQFADMLIKRSGTITEEVLVALSTKETSADALKVLERQLDRFRAKLWDYVRHLKPVTQEGLSVVWVKMTAANVTHYCTVILSGASRNILNAEQSKLFEQGISLINRNASQEIETMSNANTAAASTNNSADVNTNPVPPTNLNEESTVKNATAQTTQADTTTETVNANQGTTDAKPANETPLGDDTTTQSTAAEGTTAPAGEAEKKTNVFKRAGTYVKAKAVAAKNAVVSGAKKVRNINEWLAAKHVIYFFAALIAVVVAFFGYKKVADTETGGRVLENVAAFFQRLGASIKEAAQRVSAFFKGLFSKTAEAADDVVAEVPAAA